MWENDRKITIVEKLMENGEKFSPLVMKIFQKKATQNSKKGQNGLLGDFL